MIPSVTYFFPGLRRVKGVAWGVAMWRAVRVVALKGVVKLAVAIIITMISSREGGFHDKIYVRRQGQLMHKLPEATIICSRCPDDSSSGYCAGVRKSPFRLLIHVTRCFIQIHG